jgi:hypothetical protein
MPVASPSSTSLPSRAPLLRAGRALLAAVVIGALGLVGYDAWLWLFAGDALERITGVQVDAQLRLHVRLVPVSTTRTAHAHPLHIGSEP